MSSWQHINRLIEQLIYVLQQNYKVKHTFDETRRERKKRTDLKIQTETLHSRKKRHKHTEICISCYREDLKRERERERRKETSSRSKWQTDRQTEWIKIQRNDKQMWRLGRPTMNRMASMDMLSIINRRYSAMAFACPIVIQLTYNSEILLTP